MLHDEFLPKAEKDLHAAICNAVFILNTYAGNLAKVADAKNCLSKALWDYPEAFSGDHVPAWVPYLSDRADGVQGHFAIARYDPIQKVREVWNLRNDCWASASDEVLTLDEALALLKTMSFATTPHSKNKKD